jgi:hexokinase
MGLCYLCEKEPIGMVFGGYFCEKCEKIKKIVELIGIDKVADKIKITIKKLEIHEEGENYKV